MSGNKLIGIHTRIRESEYKKLSEIRDKYGFRSDFELLRGVVGVLLKFADPEIEVEKDEPENEIKEMFNEFTNAESPVYKQFVRPHNRTIYEYEKNE